MANPTPTPEPHTWVLTLVFMPASPVPAAAIFTAKEALGAVQMSRERWLAGHAVWRAEFEPRHPDQFINQRKQLIAATASFDMDAHLLPAAAATPKRLLAIDMESTVIEQEMIDEIANAMGIGDRIADLTARTMRGEIDFETSLRHRVSLLAGCDVDLLHTLASIRITYSPGAQTLIRTMQANGGHCALVTGGFSIFAERVAHDLGFNSWHANTLDVRDSKLTGGLSGPVIGPHQKASILEDLRQGLSLLQSDTIAAGDGSNDIPMLAAAGLGVAYRAKPVVAAHALSTANGASIVHGDLASILYLQGLDPGVVPAR
jgi:phosphoserine phosphatase